MPLIMMETIGSTIIKTLPDAVAIIVPGAVDSLLRQRSLDTMHSPGPSPDPSPCSDTGTAAISGSSGNASRSSRGWS